MKVGIITFHFVSNQGGVLQAFASQTFMEKHGHEAYIINYRPSYHTIRYASHKNPFIYARWYWRKFDDRQVSKRIQLTLRSFARCLVMNVKHSDSAVETCFENFIKTNLHETGLYKSLRQLQNNPPAFDAYISGSDQLWGPDLLDREFDPAYFLEFGGNIPKITYAVSTGRELTENENSQLRKLCKGLTAVSMREYNKATASSIGKDVHICIDPTLLLDASDYASIESQNVEVEPYIFVYGFETTDVIRQAVDLAAKKFRCKVINGSPTRIKLEGEAVNLRNYGPDRFLSLIKNAQCVVTNSFHGTAFSIIYKKEFITVPHSTRGRRMVELLGKLDLQKRLWGTEKFTINEPINWGSAYEKLNVLRQHSGEYLLSAIQGVLGEEIPHWDEEKVGDYDLEISVPRVISTKILQGEKKKGRRVITNLKKAIIRLYKRQGALTVLNRDMKRIKKWSADSVTSYGNGAQDARTILIQSHVVEKGLSHKVLKPLFGLKKVSSISVAIESYLKHGGKDAYVIGTGISALNKYNSFNSEKGVSEDELITIPKTVESFKDIITDAYEISEQEFFSGAGKEFSELCKKRHSLRLYDSKSDPISSEDIIECIKIAQNCPNACNRQSVRVKIITDSEKIETISKYQGGCTGFGENSGAMLIVTSDLSYYAAEEHKMAMVDSGIFTMNLLYSLYNKRLGSCVLNAVLKDSKIEKQVRELAKIPEHEDIAVIIAVSKIPEGNTVKIARSYKRDVQDIISTI